MYDSHQQAAFFVLSSPTHFPRSHPISGWYATLSMSPRKVLQTDRCKLLLQVLQTDLCHLRNRRLSTIQCDHLSCSTSTNSETQFASHTLDSRCVSERALRSRRWLQRVRN